MGAECKGSWVAGWRKSYFLLICSTLAARRRFLVKHGKKKKRLKRPAVVYLDLQLGLADGTPPRRHKHQAIHRTSHGPAERVEALHSVAASNMWESGVGSRESLPGGFLAQSIEEGVGVEELREVQRVRQESLTAGALHPTLDAQTHRLK